MVCQRDVDWESSIDTADIYVSGGGNVSAQLTMIVRNDAQIAVYTLRVVRGDDERRCFSPVRAYCDVVAD